VHLLLLHDGRRANETRCELQSRPWGSRADPVSAHVPYAGAVASLAPCTAHEMCRATPACRGCSAPAMRCSGGVSGRGEDENERESGDEESLGPMHVQRLLHRDTCHLRAARAARLWCGRQQTRREGEGVTHSHRSHPARHQRRPAAAEQGWGVVYCCVARQRTPLHHTSAAEQLTRGVGCWGVGAATCPCTSACRTSHRKSRW
jgi:hypothetical protein